ncbi:Vitamin B12 transporter BtuB [Crenothrix polyspora]|uniref:Vitamin B12 transporter BtuB n=1 Tax=Crenothrix polyspora TaxID=360316 RepID=A0A1R4H7G4_9GAMM|nr:TonB-dependent receptor [Crenothrix polyspora]SJM92139.1 Vitamin B12 transporter BtuB [Crenothrix polyspora]
MKKILFSSLLFTGVNTPFVHAQTNTDQASIDLPEMVVTATRSVTPKKQLSAASTVYTRKDIERLQAKTFPDLLRGTTGIDMTQQGGDGKTTSVFMRGTDSKQLLVLIDGIKVGSATLGGTPFEFIPIDQVERVEIIRGPQSSLYGSEAVGGVIQIFTRKGGDSKKPRVTLDAGGGSYDTLKASGTISGKLNNTWYTAGASHYNTQGFSTQPRVNNPFGGPPLDQPDHDAYYNTAVNARVGHRFDNNAELEASFMRSQGRNDYDAQLEDKTLFINQVAALTGSMNVVDNWRTTLRLGHSFDDNSQFAPQAHDKGFVSRFYTQRWNTSWLNEIAINDNHQLMAGVDFRLDENAGSDINGAAVPNDNTNQYREKSRYDVGVFGEYHGQLLDNHFVNASVRWDKNERSGNYVAGNVGLRSNWSYGLSTFANFGNGFKAPSFNDLYWPNAGNRFLKPEESMSAEIGLAGKHSNVQWELRAYHTNLDNLINWAPAPTQTDPFRWIPSNVDKAEIQGIEAEISTQILGWNGKLNMNILSPEDRKTNKRLLRRADKTLSFDLSRSFGQFDVGGTVLAQDHRFDDAANAVKVAGYVTVDLRAAYHFDKHWLLSAKLNNLLDKQYQTVDAYNTADRNFFISIHYNN